jgi:hypothetical protein
VVAAHAAWLQVLLEDGWTEADYETAIESLG